jgi:iron complex transport system permease protein
MPASNPFNRKAKYLKISIFSFFGLILLLTLAIDLSWGAISIPFTNIWYILLGGKSPEASWEPIIWKSRLPRAFTAILVGSALAVSGLQMQTLFRNPLAGPSILGITAGASLGVAVVVLASGNHLAIEALPQADYWGSWYLVLAAIVGAALVMTAVLAIALRVRDNVVLLIVGMMMGNFTLALVGLWQYVSSPEQIRDYLLWTFGSLGGVFEEQLTVLAIVVGVGILGSGLVVKQLNILLLGENYAQSMGLSIQKMRIILIFLSSMLAGSVTAFCGPIGFVGIAVPHLARIWLNTSDHRWLVPAVALLGAIMMLLCDLVTKLAGSQASLPINSVTTLLGAPVVIWVIVSSKNLRRSF